MTRSLSSREAEAGSGGAQNETASVDSPVVAEGEQFEGGAHHGAVAPFIGPVGRKVQQHRDRARQLLAARGSRNVAVFGSVARGSDNEASDLDLLVDPPADIGLIQLTRTAIDLESLIGIRVDLVIRTGLRLRAAPTITAEAVPL